MTDKKACAACGHEIDAAARICPYCGGDPETGRRFDPAPILKSHFPTRDTAPKARFKEFLRERQGLAVAALIVVVVVLIGAAHQMITRRNEALESAAPAVPLTDLADLSQPNEEQPQVPMPDLEFAWTGQPETMEVLLVEPGAVAPPQPAQPPAGEPGQPQPGQPMQPSTGQPAARPAGPAAPAPTTARPQQIAPTRPPAQAPARPQTAPVRPQ